MRTVVTITDLTRMSGRRVCVAGVMPDGACIRPLPQTGDFEESWLFQGERAVIRPFAAVEMELVGQDPRTVPPHLEDRIVQRRYIHRGDLDPIEQYELLSEMDDGRVRTIFGTAVQSDPYGWSRWVLAGTGARSLGTVHARQVLEVAYGPTGRDGVEYRLLFQDKTKESFRLTVTDLAFRNYFDAEARAGTPPSAVAHALGKTLAEADVFLRTGLARRWDKYPDRCYLQVNGVYSFPDYLNGRCFADFSANSEWEVPF